MDIEDHSRLSRCGSSARQAQASLSFLGAPEQRRVFDRAAIKCLRRVL